jgi:hypothetical protein
MKSLKIVKANFTPAGNAYFVDKAKDSYFCPKAVLVEKGWTKAEDIKFPLYCNVNTFTYNNVDADTKAVLLNADGTPSTFTRTDIIDAFATAQELADDYADDFALDILKAQAVKSTAVSAGLSQVNVDALLAQI